MSLGVSFDFGSRFQKLLTVTNGKFFSHSLFREECSLQLLQAFVIFCEFHSPKIIQVSLVGRMLLIDRSTDT
jgi:hypothetical protein